MYQVASENEARKSLKSVTAYSKKKKNLIVHQNAQNVAFNLFYSYPIGEFTLFSMF